MPVRASQKVKLNLLVRASGIVKPSVSDASHVPSKNQDRSANQLYRENQILCVSHNLCEIQV